MGIAKIFLAITLSLCFTFSLWNVILCVHERLFSDLEAVDNWLDDNNLGQYKVLFRDLGKLKFEFVHPRHSHAVVSLTQISILSA